VRKNSIKNTRINQEVQKELSTLIQREVKDPRIAPMTSVSEAVVAPDLKTAKIYVTVFGSAEEKANTLKGLKNASAFLRTQLARNLNLRNTPVLTFVLDDSIEYGMKMNEIIQSLHISEDEDEVRTLADVEDEDDEDME